MSTVKAMKMYQDTFSDDDADLDRIEWVPIGDIRPSPENDIVYAPPDVTDPAFKRFAASIAEKIHTPLSVSLDGFIISGHRRYAAAKYKRVTHVPVIRVPITRGDINEIASDEFVRLLTEYNDQRVKTIAEQIRESVVAVDPDDAYTALTLHRAEQSSLKMKPLKIVGKTERTELTAARVPFFNEVVAIINGRQKFWPLSDRQIHYCLLNNPPLIHAKKPGSRYKNDKASYHALTLLFSSARVLGRIPWNVISDTTRPVVHYEGYPEPGAFIKQEVDGMLRGYYRNLQQSQPNHIELLGEKNTIEPIMREIASYFTIPCTITRGYPSLPPRHDIAKRFKASGKDKLIILVASDFDPEGENIPVSIARSLRDDFKVREIRAFKVAITAKQIKRFKLKPNAEAKISSSRYKGFVGEHGKNVFELEALDPLDLDSVIREGVEAVLRRELFNAELDAERDDAVRIEKIRQQLFAAVQAIDLEGDE